MRAAIVPTRNRVEDFNDCVAAIRPQVDFIVAVAHGRHAFAYATFNTDVKYTVPYMKPVPNISAMWRAGMDVAKADGARWLAFLNDDAIVSGNWFDTLHREADRLHAAGASAPRSPGSAKIMGYAFILDAASGVVPDERMRWWYSDDAIQKRCEAHSWFALCDDALVEHRHPNESTQGALRRVSREDRALFRRVYQ